MAFNLSDTISAAGCEEKIIFFDFMDKTLKYHSEFEMERRVNFLKFIGQQFNQLLSVIIQGNMQWLAAGIEYGYLSFWRCKYNKWQSQKTFNDLDKLLCVSFNYSSSKLISGGKNKGITIYQFDKSWTIVQKIYVKSEVMRIKFFGNQFICYESNINLLSFYKFSGDNFQKANVQKIQGNGKAIQYYPISRSKNGLVITHSKFLSFFYLHTDIKKM